MVKTPHLFPLQGVRVGSLVGELRSLKLRGPKKKKKNLSCINWIGQGHCIKKSKIFKGSTEIYLPNIKPGNPLEGSKKKGGKSPFRGS